MLHVALFFTQPLLRERLVCRARERNLGRHHPKVDLTRGRRGGETRSRRFSPCRGGGGGKEEPRSHLEKGSYGEASQAGNSLCVRREPSVNPVLRAWESRLWRGEEEGRDSGGAREVSASPPGQCVYIRRGGPERVWALARLEHAKGEN